MVRALLKGSSYTWIQYKQLMSKCLVADVKSHLHATHQQQLPWTVAAEATPLYWHLYLSNLMNSRFHSHCRANSWKAWASGIVWYLQKKNKFTEYRKHLHFWSFDLPAVISGSRKWHWWLWHPTLSEGSTVHTCYKVISRPFLSETCLFQCLIYLIQFFFIRFPYIEISHLGTSI